MQLVWAAAIKEHHRWTLFLCPPPLPSLSSILSFFFFLSSCSLFFFFFKKKFNSIVNIPTWLCSRAVVFFPLSPPPSLYVPLGATSLVSTLLGRDADYDRPLSVAVSVSVSLSVSVCLRTEKLEQPPILLVEAAADEIGLWLGCWIN